MHNKFTFLKFRKINISSFFFIKKKIMKHKKITELWNKFMCASIYKSITLKNIYISLTFYGKFISRHKIFIVCPFFLFSCLYNNIFCISFDISIHSTHVTCFSAYKKKEKSNIKKKKKIVDIFIWKLATNNWFSLSYIEKRKFLLTLPLEIYHHHQFEHIYHENLKMNLLCGLVDVQIETMYPPIAGEMYNLVMLKQENKNNMMRIMTRTFLFFSCCCFYWFFFCCGGDMRC